MSIDVAEYVRYQICNAPLRAYPFPHFFIQPVFPEDFYQELQGHLPPTSALKPIDEYQREQRYIADIAALEEDEDTNHRGDLWRRTSEWLMSDAFCDLVIGKFSDGIKQRFGDGARLHTEIDARFVRDFTHYTIHPHTDQPKKLVSLLFYLPRDKGMRHLGTTIYQPLDPALRCEGAQRHPFEKFKQVATMEFLPNSLFGFLKTDRSFHGVPEIRDRSIERNVLLYNIYLRKVVVRQAKGAGWSWPWKRRRAAS